MELPNGQCEGLGIRRDSKKIRSDDLKVVYAMLWFNCSDSGAEEGRQVQI